MHYFRIYERQKAEEAVRNEFEFPADGKPKKMPPPKRFRQLVDDRIAEWHKD